MVDKDSVIGIKGVIPVHDKTRQVPKTVYPVWTGVESPIMVRCLKANKCCGFIFITVEYHFFHTLKFLIVLDKGAKELVNHPSFDPLALPVVSIFEKFFHPRFDKVGVAFPFLKPLVGITIPNCTGCVITNFLPFASNTEVGDQSALRYPIDSD